MLRVPTLENARLCPQFNTGTIFKVVFLFHSQLSCSASHLKEGISSRHHAWWLAGNAEQLTSGCQLRCQLLMSTSMQPRWTALPIPWHLLVRSSAWASTNLSISLMSIRPLQCPPVSHMYVRFKALVEHDSLLR